MVFPSSLWALFPTNYYMLYIKRKPFVSTTNDTKQTLIHLVLVLQKRRRVCTVQFLPTPTVATTSIDSEPYQGPIGFKFGTLILYSVLGIVIFFWIVQHNPGAAKDLQKLLQR